jgi:hypothetical protein
MQGAPKAIDLRLSTFDDEQGNSAAVNLLLPGEPKRQPQPEQLGITLSGQFLPVYLSVPKLPTLGKFVGRLFVAAKGRNPLVWKITLIRSSNFRPATLVLDRGAVTLAVTKPFLFHWRENQSEFMIHVREKNGQWPLEGITARLEQVSKAPGQGFDLKRNLSFTFNGRPVPDFGSSADATSRRIGEGEQATIGIILKHLSAGEYNAVIRFQAMNSGDDDGQKLALTLQARDSIYWAILILLVSLGFSFLATKVVAMFRQQLAFLRQLDELRPSWLTTEPPILAVVAVRAALRQAEDLSRRFWLTGQQGIEDRVNKLASTVSVLEQAREIRETFEQHALKDFLRIRATVALKRIVSRLDPRGFSDQTAAQFKAELAALTAWVQPNQQAACYWADLSKAIAGLLEEVRPDAITDANAKSQIESLVRDLADPRQPGTIEEMMAVESEYARLKILWERHLSPEFLELVQLPTQSPALEDLFKLADQRAWDRIKEASKDPESVRIIPPQEDEEDSIQAYAPLTFGVEALKDSSLNDTYLFQYGLSYRWRFELDHKGGKLILAPVSAGPRVVQYMPKPGSVTVTVRIVRDGDSVELHGAEPLKVDKSEEFSIGRAFERVEYLSFGLAGLAAMVSGLTIYYAKSQIFGSLEDYLSLFVWGAGVDQGKNLLQALQVYSPTAKNP